MLGPIRATVFVELEELNKARPKGSLIPEDNISVVEAMVAESPSGPIQEGLVSSDQRTIFDDAGQEDFVPRDHVPDDSNTSVHLQVSGSHKSYL
jgi:hypothetical protein